MLDVVHVNFQLGAKQDESETSNLTKYAEEAAKEIKRSILAGEEISFGQEREPVLPKLKEALKAQDLAELLIPVANTDSAREAGESVKNAVANATAAATKVREASSVLKSAIAQTIVESTREGAVKAKNSAETNANIAQTASAHATAAKANEALTEIDQTLEQLKSKNITEEEEIDDLLDKVVKADGKAKAADWSTAKEAAKVNPEETARVAAELAHVAAAAASNLTSASQLESKEVSSNVTEAEPEGQIEIKDAANKSFAAAEKADELLAQIRGQPEAAEKATEAAMQAVAERNAAEKEEKLVEAKVAQLKGEKTAEEISLTSRIEETVAEIEKAKEAANKVVEEAIQNNPKVYVVKVKEKVELLKEKAGIVEREIITSNSESDTGQKLVETTNTTMLAIGKEVTEVGDLVEKTMQEKNGDSAIANAVQATTILAKVENELETLEAIKVVTVAAGDVEAVAKRANDSALQTADKMETQGLQQSEKMNKSRNAVSDAANKVMENTKTIKEMVSLVAKNTSKQNLKKVVEQAANYIVEGKRYDVIALLDEKLAEREKISQIKKEVLDNERKTEEAANAAQEKSEISKTEAATKAAETAKALAEKSKAAVKKLEEIEECVIRDQLEVLTKDADEAVAAAQKATTNAIECSFIAKNDRPTQSAAAKAMEATEEAESGATRIKDEAKKLVNEESDVNREKEITRLSLSSQKVTEAAEKAKGIALEAAFAAAKINPIAVATKYVEEARQVAKEATEKVSEARQLITADNSGIAVEKVNGIIDAAEHVVEETVNASNNVGESLAKVGNSTDQENLVQVAKDIILQSVIPQFMVKENQAFNDIRSLTEESAQKKRNKDVDNIQKEAKDLLDKALVEKGKAAEEAAMSNPVESAANSAEKAKNLSMQILSSMTKVNNMTSEISKVKDAALKVAVDTAAKSAKEIEEIAERSKESKDEKEKVDLAKEAEKELKTVEQAKTVVEKALVEKEEMSSDTKYDSNELKAQSKEIVSEIIKTIEESEKSLNLSNKLEQSLSSSTEISEAKKEAEDASQKAQEAVDLMKVELEKFAEPTKEVDAETIIAVEGQVKAAKKLENKARKLTNSAVDKALREDPRSTSTTIAQVALEAAETNAKFAAEVEADASKTENEKVKSLAGKAVKAAKNAKNAAELATEEAKLSVNDSDTDTASQHALDAKVFAAQAIFESKISALTAIRAKEELGKEEAGGEKCPANDEDCIGVKHLMNEISKLKEDVSTEEKIETEAHGKKEQNIDSIQKETEEAAEKARNAADDALMAKLLTEKHLKVLNKTEEVVDIITSARESNQKAKDYAIDAERLVTKVKEESGNIEAAEEDKEKAKVDAEKAEEASKKATEAERRAAGIVAREKVLEAEPNTLATVHKVLHRVASFILKIFNSKNKGLALVADGGNEHYEVKPKENETAKERSNKSKQPENIKVEGNDQDVLSYFYN